MLEIDENTLITRAQHGEVEAFDPLVRKYHRRLYTHIHGRVKDVEITEDLTQETWLRAFRGIRSFRCKSAFYSWLYRIAENVCTDYFRKTPDDTVPLHLCSEQRITSVRSCPSRDIERAELREQFQVAIGELSPIRRRVFHLYYPHEVSIKSIAERLKRSEGTIKTHLRNARLQLQDVLTPYLKTLDRYPPV